MISSYFLWNELFFSLIISPRILLSTQDQTSVCHLVCRYGGLQRVCRLVRRDPPRVKCSPPSSKGPGNCVFCDSKYFCWKKPIYTKYHYTVAFEQFKKETNLQISNYGASAEAGFVACLCFHGHLARTKIAVLDPEGKWFSRFISDPLDRSLKVVNFQKEIVFSKYRKLVFLKKK